MEAEGRIHGLKFGCHDLFVSHLLFADDSFIFLEAKKEEYEALKEALDLYEATSGQMINLEKSEACFGKDIEVGRQGYVADFLKIKVVDCHEKYIGLPTFAGRCKRDLFKFIKNRVWDKLKGWNRSVFSAVGKEVLLKVVVQAIPTYSMSCFKLPKTLIRYLHRLIADLWWGSKAGNSKMHLGKWNEMCNSKERGGIGFRDLRCFNQALLAKQGWRLLKKPDSLVTKVLKACYYPSRDILTAKKRSKPSFVWRSIIWGREVIEKGSR
ncbi:hypothetical protein UlMin_019673 [Ulmus minor]